ncbi:hypothetical protein [Dysgonomonas termitidis]|uniref:Uncharacterized protein n=1 Tax=Dysgonomonas termitidis TaxID=1516126 RepID=A0ABV9L1S9_9BACT
MEKKQEGYNLAIENLENIISNPANVLSENVRDMIETSVRLLKVEQHKIITCMELVLNIKNEDIEALSSQLTACKEALREIVECTCDMEKAKTDLEYNIRSAERKVLIDKAKTLIE